MGGRLFDGWRSGGQTRLLKQMEYPPPPLAALRARSPFWLQGAFVVGFVGPTAAAVLILVFITLLYGRYLEYGFGDLFQ